MIPRLSEATAPTLPVEVERPRYDRSTALAGVVHLGIGAFHRAHQAAVFDRLLEDDPRWMVRAASLRSSAVRDAMTPQDGLYCLVERDPQAEHVRLIGSVRDVLVAPEDPKALVEALGSPDTHLVTLTITEKGYKLDPASGALLEEDADVAADLVSLASPRTAPAFLVAGLALRRARGLKPFTAISCDNLPHNGARLEAAVLALAERHDPALRDWIGKHGAFPETMVDRIVPATNSQDIERLAGRIRLTDGAMVKTEPFLQWVMEDRFAGERPDFAAAGIQVTRDVAPWEEAKLRLLNGAHSAIAYLGGLAGIEFVHEFVADPPARRFVDALWDEAAVTLTPPPELNVPDYRAALMERFSNSSLQHRTRQIAMDGSQKIPQRLLQTAAARLERGLGIDALALAIAAWMRWQSGQTDAGERFTVDDPLASSTERRLAGAGSARERVRVLLGLRSVFPERLAADPGFEDSLVGNLERLESGGARSAIQHYLANAAR